MKGVWKKITSMLLSASLLTGSWMGAFPANAAETGSSNEKIQQQFYVSVKGNDEGDGSKENPFATVERARQAVDEINDNMTGNIIVNIGAGEYYLEDTLRFDEGDSGTNGYQVIYRNLDGLSSAKLIGGKKVESEWELVDASGDPTVTPDADLPASAEGKVYKTHVGTNVDFNTLYVNDKRATLARTQNRENENGFSSALTPYMRSAGGGVGDLIYNSGDLDEESINGLVNAQARGDLNASVYMWDGGYWDWMTDTIPVSAIDTEARRLTYKTVEGHPEMYRPKYATRNNARYFVQGNLGFLDAPGEYYFNDVTGDLYYYPEGDIEDQKIVIPCTQEIVRVEGTSKDSMVENITFSGLQFKDTDTTEWYAYGWNWGDAGDGLGFYPPEAEGSTQPSYCEQTERIEFQYGNITLKNTNNISILNSHIKNSGMFGIELYLANQNARIENCLIEYTGHGGINIDGGYPGVAGDENGDGYSRDNVIRNCLIHDIGELIGQASGITIQQSGYNMVSHVEVYNSPRRGLFLTAGNSRNPGTSFPNGDKDYNAMTDMYTHHNTIEYVYLHDCQQDGGDDGAFFVCYLYKGSNNKPNYVNQMVIEDVAANPSMTDIAPNCINLDMGASGMELSNVKAVNPQHFNMEVNTITQYGDKIKFDNVNIDFGTHTNYLEEFDDSKMEYDNIGVTSDFPAEYLPETPEKEIPDDIYFQEDFEQGLDDSKWYSKGGTPEITTEWMSEGVFDGRQALQINSDKGKPVLYREFDEPLNKVVTMQMFDRAGFNLCPYESGININANITTYGRVDNGETAVGMGIDNSVGGGSDGYYVLQIGDEKTKTDIGRFFGWHELKWDYSSGTDVKLYFDGKLVKTLTEEDGVSMSFDYVSMGSEEGSGITFFDELFVYGGQYAPPVEPLPEVYLIPGKLEAENYLNVSGVETEECTDTDGGLNITGIDQNDWMEYNVKVESDGIYDLKYRLDIPEGETADFDVLVDGEFVKMAQFASAGEGWQDYSQQVTLKAGPHKIRLVSHNSGWKLNWIETTFVGKMPSSKIEAEDFIEKEGMQLDGPGLGFIGQGNWAEYQVVIPKAGEYTVNYQIAANRDAAGIEFTVNGEVLATTPFKYTGGWSNWATVSDTVTFKEAGKQTIRLNMLSGDFNFDYFVLVAEDVSLADKTELKACYEEYAGYEQEKYTAESWKNFKEALDTVRATLENEDATQDEVDSAVKAIQDAAAALEEVGGEPVEPADKTLLQKTYDYALTLDTEGVVESAVELFEKAKANAKAVLDDPNATQDEVNAAWDELLESIWGLGITQGDKTQMEMLIARAEQMMENADKYVDTHWQEFVDALDKAKEVMEDGDALEEDVQSASGNLLNAILMQRYKANKDNLEDLIQQANGIDLSQYTAKSVAVFKAALENANLVLADTSLSEDDQSVVDSAVQELETAIKNLSTADETPSNPDEPNNGDETPSTSDKGDEGAKSPTTGDNSNAAVLFIVVFASMMLATLAVIRRKKQNEM